MVTRMRAAFFLSVILALAAPIAWAASDLLGPGGALSEAERQALLDLQAPASAATSLPAVPSQGDLSARLNATGEYLGLPFTREVKEGYQAAFRGEFERALALIDEASRSFFAKGILGFRLQGLRADFLSRIGRAADAEQVLEGAAAKEKDYWGQTLLSLAMRGEARARLGDDATAEGDLGRVALRQKGWWLPTSFSSYPNMSDLVLNTEAKFRANLGLASLYTRSGRYPLGLAWAIETERHFASLFALAQSEYAAHVPLVPEFYIGRAENLAYLGASAIGVERDAQAGDRYLAAADRLFASVGYGFGRAVGAALKAKALDDSGFADAFETAAVNAIALAVESNLSDLVWPLELLRGQRAFRAGRMAEARASLRRAQDALDLVSGSLASDRAKLRFGFGKETVTALLAEIDLDQGDFDSLVHDLERGRARAFVDLMATQTVKAGADSEAVQAVRDLDRAIRTQRLGRATAGAALMGAGPSEGELIRRRAERIDDLRRRNPDLAEVLAIAAPELGALRSALGPGDALVYPVPGLPERPLRLLLVGSEGSRLLTLGIDEAGLKRRVGDFMDAVAAKAADHQKASAAALSDALQLAQWRVTRTAYLVPTGDFHFVPWGALTLSHAVAVLPTAGWLIRPPQEIGAGARAVVVGDPDFRGALAALPGARAEARAVAALYGAEPLLGAAATEEALRAALGGGADLLHLATHGRFEATDPLRSAVFLSGPAGPAVLTAARIFEAPLPARLVVLSACETGAGTAVAGDDFLGLVRSFFLGGARTVVNSLWPIDDIATQTFMEHFHRAARHGRPGQAWLVARDALRQAGFPPSAYGAFVLSGLP